MQAWKTFLALCFTGSRARYLRKNLLAKGVIKRLAVVDESAGGGLADHTAGQSTGMDVKDRLVAALDGAGLTDQRAIELSPDQLLELHHHLLRKGLHLRSTSKKSRAADREG